jgi:hypothetical protein
VTVGIRAAMKEPPARTVTIAWTIERQWTTEVKSRLPARCLASRQSAPALGPVCDALNRIDDAQASDVTRKASYIRRGCDDVQPRREDWIERAHLFFSASNAGRAIDSAPGRRSNDFGDRESPATGVAQGTGVARQRASPIAEAPATGRPMGAALLSRVFPAERAVGPDLAVAGVVRQHASAIVQAGRGRIATSVRPTGNEGLLIAEARNGSSRRAALICRACPAERKVRLRHRQRRARAAIIYGQSARPGGGRHGAPLARRASIAERRHRATGAALSAPGGRGNQMLTGRRP